MGVPGPIVVAVLTRAPSRGGKSRLFAALGCDPDPALLSALLLDTLDGVAVPALARVVMVEPADACDEVRTLVSRDIAVHPQPTGSLGERMRETMDSLFEGGASVVVLVGSDLPDITPARIERAIALLTHDPHSLVLGPADDGGYYLIAATTTPNVFDEIEWGTGRVLEQTRAIAERRGLRIHLIDTLRDVDSPDDLRSVSASRTRAWCAASSSRMRNATDRR